MSLEDGNNDDPNENITRVEGWFSLGHGLFVGLQFATLLSAFFTVYLVFANPEALEEFVQEMRSWRE